MYCDEHEPAPETVRSKDVETLRNIEASEPIEELEPASDRMFNSSDMFGVIKLLGDDE